MMRKRIGMATLLVSLGLCVGLAACTAGDETNDYTATSPAATTTPSESSITDIQTTPSDIASNNNPPNAINPIEINPNSPHWDDIFTGDGILVLDEENFVEWVQVIHLHRELFIGRTVQFEGFFISVLWGDEGEVIHSVSRFTSGCCGLHGFEVYLNEIPQPPEETWVEVTGVLEMLYIEEIGASFLRVSVTELIMR